MVQQENEKILDMVRQDSEEIRENVEQNVENIVGSEEKHQKGIIVKHDVVEEIPHEYDEQYFVFG